MSYPVYYEDYFPRTLRGHGQAHQSPWGASSGVNNKRRPRCVQSVCKGGAAHIGRGENVDDYKDDHGIPNHRANIARSKQRKLDAAAIKDRSKYTPAPRVGKPAPYVAPVKCDSCSRIPSGEKNDEGLTLGLCGRCWKIGHTLKHFSQDDGGKEQVAA